MEHQEIADRVGVNLADLESLRRGKCTANVARSYCTTLRKTIMKQAI